MTGPVSPSTVVRRYGERERLNAIIQNNPLHKCRSSGAGHTFQSQEITPRGRRGRFHLDTDDFTGRVLKNKINLQLLIGNQATANWESSAV